jgi:NADPH-dependent 2,4-dienoyl-CoA reductase/sulfur reductase-like enzyme
LALRSALNAIFSRALPRSPMARMPLGALLSCCRAAPGLYAAGDVASWHNPHFGARMRVEHRLNAAEQAMAVARNLLGADQPFASVPYFWSGQYDVRIQAHGIFPEGARITLLRGDLASRKFVVAYGQQGKVVGALGWNSPRELRDLRQLVVDRASCPPPALNMS